MKITNYEFETDRLQGKLRIALVSDLHSHNPQSMLRAVRKTRPDIICIAGDLTEALDGSMDGKNEYGFIALRALCEIAPTFYAPGNHEIAAYHLHHVVNPDPRPGADRISAQNRARIDKTGARFLENTFTEWHDILIGGLGSGMLETGGVPRMDALEGFLASEGFKILLCHHPEYYAKYLRTYDVDLVLAGHAHGGQWRLFGKGLYAPDQGLFPKYTSGVHEGRLVISKGTANTGGMIPRLFNPREVVCIRINESKERES